MMRPAYLLAVLAGAALVWVAVTVVFRADYPADLMSCAEQQLDLLPAERVAACLCLVEESQALRWRLWRLVASQAAEKLAERAARNTCLATDLRSRS